MNFDFLSLWELTLRPDLSDEELKTLIPNKFGKLQEVFDDFTLSSSGKNLIMLMGVPGSGKSTMAEKLKKHCINMGLTCKIISVDNMISEYFMNNRLMLDIDTDLASIQMTCLQNEFNASADQFDVIVLDGTFLSISDRFVILKPASEYFSNIVGVFLDTSEEILREVQSERIFKRISEEDFEYYQGQVKMILEEKENLPIGFDVVYIIHR